MMNTLWLIALAVPITLLCKSLWYVMILTPTFKNYYSTTILLQSHSTVPPPVLYHRGPLPQSLLTPVSSQPTTYTSIRISPAMEKQPLLALPAAFASSISAFMHCQISEDRK